MWYVIIWPSQWCLKCKFFPIVGSSLSHSAQTSRVAHTHTHTTHTQLIAFSLGQAMLGSMLWLVFVTMTLQWKPSSVGMLKSGRILWNQDACCNRDTIGNQDTYYISVNQDACCRSGHLCNQDTVMYISGHLCNQDTVIYQDTCVIRTLLYIRTLVNQDTHCKQDTLMFQGVWSTNQDTSLIRTLPSHCNILDSMPHVSTSLPINSC